MRREEDYKGLLLYLRKLIPWKRIKYKQQFELNVIIIIISSSFHKLIVNFKEFALGCYHLTSEFDCHPSNCVGSKKALKSITWEKTKNDFFITVDFVMKSSRGVRRKTFDWKSFDEKSSLLLEFHFLTRKLLYFLYHYCPLPNHNRVVRFQ